MFQPPVRDGAARLHERQLIRLQIRVAFDEQSVAIHGKETAANLVRRQSRRGHQTLQLAADAAAGRTRAEMTMRWSRKVPPVTAMAANSVPAAIAAVPWMSSLNEHNQ